MRRLYIIVFMMLMFLLCSGCENMTDENKKPSFPENFSGTLNVEYEGQKYTFVVNNNEKGSYIEVVNPQELAGMAYEIPYNGEIIVTYNELSFHADLNMLDSSSVIMRLHSVLQYPQKLKSDDGITFTDDTITLSTVEKTDKTESSVNPVSSETQ